jgi:hypothetical protein
MLQTSFFHQLQSMLQESRQAMRFSEASADAVTDAASPAASNSAAPSSSSSFDIVIYGIGRFCEWSLNAASNDPSVDVLTPSLVRSCIRSASRPPQLQLACIVAVARSHAAGATPSSSDPATASAAASTSAAASVSTRMFMYDPMLSALEKAVATAMGIEMIAENEEGRPTAATKEAEWHVHPVSLHAHSLVFVCSVCRQT